jgi:hypothetical protein
VNDLLKILPKRPDGYWLDASTMTPDVPEWGPYDTKAEATEARRSFLRNGPQKMIREAIQ